MKISLMLSIFLKNFDTIKPILKIKKNNEEKKIENLNICIISENDSIVLNSILNLTKELKNFYKWPFSCTQQDLINFLLKSNNGIIFISDPQRLKKFELKILNRILSNEEISFEFNTGFKINSAIWILTSIHKKLTVKKINNYILILLIFCFYFII